MIVNDYSVSLGLERRFTEEELDVIIGGFDCDLMARLIPEEQEEEQEEKGEFTVDTFINYCLENEEDDNETHNPQEVTIAFTEEFIQDILDNPEQVTEIQNDFVKKIYAKINGKIKYHWEKGEERK